MLKSTVKERFGLERNRSHVGHRQTSDPIHRRRQAQGQPCNQWQTRARPPGLRRTLMRAVTEEQLPTIAVVRVIENISKIEFVRKLLSESKKLGLKKPLLLMDREFSNVEVMHFLHERDERFLMAVSKTPGIKKTVSEFRCGKRKAISKYEMRSNDGTTFRFWPVIKNVSRERRVRKNGST